LDSFHTPSEHNKQLREGYRIEREQNMEEKMKTGKQRLMKLALAGALLLVTEATFAQTDFWQQTNGPYGGPVRVLAVDSAGYVYAGTPVGLFHSTDAADTWKKTEIAGFVYDILVTGGGEVFVGASPESVYRSSDNGESWTAANVGMGRTAVRKFAANSQGDLFAATSLGIYLSVDNADNWSLISPGTIVNSFAFTGAGDILAGTDNGLIRSTDNGITWNPAGLDTVAVGPLLVNNDGHIFAGSKVINGGLFRSTDDGQTWMPVNKGLRYRFSLAIPPIYSLSLNSNGDLFLGGDRVYRSIDNGDNWVRLEAGLTDVLVYSIVFDRAGRVYAATPKGGVFRSDNNGDSWHQMNTGLLNSFVSALAFDPNGVLYAGTWDGVHISGDNGESWVKKSNGLIDNSGRNPSVTAFAFDSAGHIFAGTLNDIFRSADNGENWSLVDYRNAEALAINRAGHIFAASRAGLLFSMDAGSTWVTVGGGLPETEALTLLLSAEDHLFVSMKNKGLYRSMDNGASWLPINAGLTDSSFSRLAINPNSGNIYASSGSSIFHSSDNGDTWRFIYMPDVHVIALAINARGDIFAGNYRSLDNGETWEKHNRGISGSIHAFAFNSTGHAFAGTIGFGVFRSIESTTPVREITAEIPQNFALEQNYPNPFNPGTVISFRLPVSSQIKLHIYNLTGQMVRTLVDAQKSAGRHQVVWDGLNERGGHLPSGVYLYRIEAGDFRAVRRLAMVK
jgi:photosystem II stability/assembly factor-like uncharacterized protein